MTEEKDPDPETKPVEENPEIENSRDPISAPVDFGLISVIDIGPTQISEAVETKSPAQRKSSSSQTRLWRGR